ncbi:CcdC family protein [Metabacillus sp. 84]|uniref:CcdC family protein n=1 Tax=unclassified Metabacillus TaxID=2675274 RepID=UPI003CEAA781
MDLLIISTILAVFMGCIVLVVRMRASRRPASAKKIILPPLFMSTGALMFVFPFFRVTFAEFSEAILAGMFFSIFLIKTSKFEIRDNEIYLKRSKAFAFILVALLALRIGLKSVLSLSIDVGALSGMFWILAFGMIVPWRIAMYVSFKKIQNQLNPPNSQAT